MKPIFAIFTIVIAITLIGCDSESRYSPLRSPAYIDIGIEGHSAPLRVSSRKDIRSITSKIDLTFIDNEQFRVKHDGSKNELWIWVDYPYPDGKGGTYPVSIYLHRDGRIGFVASMVCQYEITNTAYRDAVLYVATKYLTAKGKPLDILK